MTPQPKAGTHHSRVFVAPWSGIYRTHILSGQHLGRHWHSTYGFGVMEEGAHRSASGRGTVDAYAGDVITTNPGEVHDGRPHGGPSRRWRIVSVERELMTSIAGQCAEIAEPVIRDPRLARVLRRLFRRIERGADPLACEESLVESCVLLMTRHGTAPAVREAPADMRRVRERLAEELAAPPSLAELAAMEGLSRYQRAERARKLIGNGSSLGEAAAASGFADQSHMTRVFSRHFGFTPGAWRKALQ